MATTPISERAVFEATYRAWRAATDAYDAKMQSAMRGDEVDWSTMRAECVELGRLHDDFIEKSKPFVRWRR